MPAATEASTNTEPGSIRFLRWEFYTTSWADGVAIAAFPESRRPQFGTQGILLWGRPAAASERWFAAAKSG